MATTQPIREKDDLQNFINYYKTDVPNIRNYTLIVFGLHTALRISDILKLKWKDVYLFEKNCFVEHLSIKEQKTGKSSMIALHDNAVNALSDYFSERNPSPDDYVFSKRTTPKSPLCRSQAYRLVRKAAEETMTETNISCHSLRKTFGYHAYHDGISPALLMDIFNHSSFETTKRYLGIKQEERDSLFKNMNF